MLRSFHWPFSCFWWLFSPFPPIEFCFSRLSRRQAEPECRACWKQTPLSSVQTGFFPSELCPAELHPCPTRHSRLKTAWPPPFLHSYFPTVMMVELGILPTPNYRKCSSSLSYYHQTIAFVLLTFFLPFDDFSTEKECNYLKVGIKQCQLL